MEPLRIAVLGAGLMGSGIASLLADAGHAVTAWDVRPTALETVSSTYPNVQTTTDLATAVSEADIVMEAIAENLEAKHELYGRISEINTACIVASNTSSLPASSLAQGIVNPARFAIAHFFNPARVVPLVELVPASDTEPATLNTLKSVLEAAGKLPVVLNKEVPGFVANRLQAALYREAYALAADGVASYADIDLVVRAGLGSRWAAAGPMTVTDLGGLDIWNAVMGQLFPLLSNSTQVPAAVAEAVERGDLGSKTGKGVYEHTAQEDEIVRKRMAAHFKLEFPDAK